MMTRSRPASRANHFVLLLLTSLLSVSAAHESQADSLPAANGVIEITPLIHSSVQLQYQGLIIQIDPWGVKESVAMLQADLILVTDSPSHHLDADTIARLSHANTTVISPGNGREALPQALVMQIGESLRVKGINIEAVAAYDIIPGAPEHPKGDANGYVVTLGGKRLFFAGVTECVAEVQALENIDVAFMPMNIPVGRMTPKAAAQCTRLLNPECVYVYHYDQDWVRRLGNPNYAGSDLPGGITVAESLEQFAAELEGSETEFVRGQWYPE